MKSSFTQRSSKREGPVMSEVYKKAVVRGGPNRKVVKLTKTNLSTDYGAQKTSGGGEIIKNIYKGGQLVKTKRKQLSANKVIRKGLI